MEMITDVLLVICVVSIPGVLLEKEYADQLSSVTCTCGWRNNLQNKLRIIEGEVVKDFEYPFVAQLIPVEKDAEVKCGYVHCGAVILSEWHVVTAAHCISPAQDYAIVASISNIETCGQGLAQIRSVASKVTHPNFNSETLENDIALLTLSSRLFFSDNRVGPVCLPATGSVDTPKVGDQLILMGWGATITEPEGSKVLLEVSLSAMDYDHCLTYFNGTNLQPRSRENQFCTYAVGEGICKGDSGGPVLSRDPASGLYFLTGLISFASDTCSTRYPSVHTRISPYIPWLIQEANEPLCQEI